MTTNLARFGYMDNTEKDDGLSAMMTDEGIKQKMREAVMDFQARPSASPRPRPSRGSSRRGRWTGRPR